MVTEVGRCGSAKAPLGQRKRGPKRGPAALNIIEFFVDRQQGGRYARRWERNAWKSDGTWWVTHTLRTSKAGFSLGRDVEDDDDLVGDSDDDPKTELFSACRARGWTTG